MLEIQAARAIALVLFGAFLPDNLWPRCRESGAAAGNYAGFNGALLLTRQLNIFMQHIGREGF